MGKIEQITSDAWRSAKERIRVQDLSKSELQEIFNRLEAMAEKERMDIEQALNNSEQH